MKKKDFIKKCAEQSGITQQKFKDILDAMGEAIVEGMRDEDGISPWKGIKFVSVYRNERTTRNPSTGEPITVPAQYVPKVKFSKVVKEAVN